MFNLPLRVLLLWIYCIFVWSHVHRQLGIYLSSCKSVLYMAYTFIWRLSGDFCPIDKYCFFVWPTIEKTAFRFTIYKLHLFISWRKISSWKILDQWTSFTQNVNFFLRVDDWNALLIGCCYRDNLNKSVIIYH